MIKKDASEGYRYYEDSPVLGDKRSPSGPKDFGDPATVGLCVKRVGLSFNNPDFKPDESFGYFLGQHPDGWVIATNKFDMSGCSGCELFADLDSLKQRWELD